MLEVSLERAKEIIAEPANIIMPSQWKSVGRQESLFKFSRMIMEAEVPTLTDIDLIGKQSHDLVHLSGVHKFRYSPNKCDELRFFWGCLWEEGSLIKTVRGLSDYIMNVCEASAHWAGKKKNPYGLFMPSSFGVLTRGAKPWRTAEWYAERRPVRIPVERITEFYPYISAKPTEDHDMILTVDKLVPKWIPNQSRADICQDMLVAVLTGEIDIENLKDGTDKYVKKFFKAYPSKYGHISLDAPIRFGESKTIGETVSARIR